MSWGNDKILDFINAIHIRPELWDVEHTEYRNRVAKRDGWEAVGGEFELSSDEAQKKFRNLRTYAKSEQKKAKSGSGAQKKKPWFAYEAMQFALGKDIPDVGLDSESSSTARESVVNEIDQQEEDEYSATDESVPSSASHKERKNRNKKKKTDSCVGIDQETLGAAKEILTGATLRQKNPSSSFGEHVAIKLNSYDPVTRSNAELAITKILHEADLKMHSSASYSTRSVTTPTGMQTFRCEEMSGDGDIATPHASTQQPSPLPVGEAFATIVHEALSSLNE